MLDTVPAHEQQDTADAGTTGGPAFGVAHLAGSLPRQDTMALPIRDLWDD
ncbi:hypothetical protein [Streptomyces sp. NBC_00388]